MKSYKTLGLAILGFLAGVTALFVAGGFREAYIPTVLLIVLGGALLSLPVSRILTGHSPWYSPHAFALASLGLIYVVAPAIALIFRFESDFYERELSPAEFQEAMVWAVAGIAAYLVGFRLGPKRTTFNRGVEWYFADTPEVRANLNAFAIVIWFAGMCAWGYMFFAVGGGDLDSFGTERGTLVKGAGGFIYHVAKFAYVGALLYFCRNGLTILSVGMIASLTFFLLIFGSRSFVGILLLGALIVYRFRFVNKIPILLWVGTAVSMFMIMGFLAALRATKDVGRAVAAYKEATATLEGKVLSVLGYFDFVIPMAEVIQNMGTRIPFQNGKTLLTVTYIIPSFLWQGQYMFQSASQIYTHTLYGDRQSKATLTPSIAAEFYMNFGGIGVIGGMLFMGLFIRWLHSRLVENPRRRYQFAWIVFSALISVNMVRVFKNGFGTTVFMFYFFAPLAMCYFPNLKFLFSPPAGPVPPVLDASGRNMDDEELFGEPRRGYDDGFDEYDEYADYAEEYAEHESPAHPG